jgi:hypothetical protein
MASEVKISKATIISVVVAFIVGFLISRAFIEEPTPIIKESIKYEPSPYVVHDTIEKPVPYEVIRDTTIYLPGKPIKVDTAAILADYFLRRKYKLDFSTDTTGTFLINAEVYENKLVNATSTVRPLYRTRTKETVIYKIPALQFYGMIGSSVDLKTNKIQFGVDLKQKFMIGASGIRLDDRYGYTLDFGVKF